MSYHFIFPADYAPAALRCVVLASAYRQNNSYMKPMLNQTQLEQFIKEGYIRLDNAFPASLAAAVRAILWNDIPADPDKPETWTYPVVRLGMYNQPPFIQAANTPVLHQAFDQLAGAGTWLPCRSMGTFPVRFPSADDPGDTGWHVDAGFPDDDPADYFKWRINIRSKGRGLLLLFLFSDISVADAPTRLRAGSHQDVARLLAGAGEMGLSFTELAGKLDQLPERTVVTATGQAGTVYLCHPFMVHAAQPHHGTVPRFLAQPPLLVPAGFDLLAADGELPPVAAAIRQAVTG